MGRADVDLRDWLGRLSCKEGVQDIHSGNLGLWKHSHVQPLHRLSLVRARCTVTVCGTLCVWDDISSMQRVKRWQAEGCAGAYAAVWPGVRALLLAPASRGASFGLGKQRGALAQWLGPQRAYLQRLPDLIPPCHTAHAARSWSPPLL